MFGLAAFVAAFIGVCQGATFTIEPYNTSAPIGGTGTIACIVTNLGSDSVQWKKVESSGTTTTISLNNNVLTNSGKYGITSTYNLTISSVASTDEATYQCVVGATTKTAYFLPVVLPTNVSVYWESSPTAGSTVNLKCKATYGNPPPSLKWYKGSVEQTSGVVYTTSNVQSSGYGDAESTLPVALQSSDQNTEIRCQAEYDGYYRAMEYTLNVQLSGSSNIQAQSILAAALIAMGMLLRSM